MKVFLIGEGQNELGGFAKEPNYRSVPPDPGVLETLLRKIRKSGWSVIDAIHWKDIRKYKADSPRGDDHNVHGAWLKAKESGADVLAFSRDRDGDKKREKAVETSLQELSKEPGPRVVGGMAIETLEGWLLALLGEHKSEHQRHPAKILAQLGYSVKDTRAATEIADAADLVRLPADAHSLRLWLARARIALCAGEAERGE